MKQTFPRKYPGSRYFKDASADWKLSKGNAQKWPVCLIKLINDKSKLSRTSELGLSFFFAIYVYVRLNLLHLIRTKNLFWTPSLWLKNTCHSKIQIDKLHSCSAAWRLLRNKYATPKELNKNDVIDRTVNLWTLFNFNLSCIIYQLGDEVLISKNFIKYENSIDLIPGTKKNQTLVARKELHVKMSGQIFFLF